MFATYGRTFVPVVVLLSALGIPWTQAADPPDLALNPVTGCVESVDLATDSGDRVRHVEDRLTALGGTAQLISTEAGISPRVACRPDGQTWVVWWHDADPDEVSVRFRVPATGEWSDEAIVSDSGEASRHPELVIDGPEAWIGYETDQDPGTGIAVKAITDSPEPFGNRVLVATTDFSGDVNVMIHADSGHVWVTWVDSSTDVGWSEYDRASETWGLPQYQAYFGGNLKAAIEAIRTAVVGD